MVPARLAGGCLEARSARHLTGRGSRRAARVHGRTVGPGRLRILDPCNRHDTSPRSASLLQGRGCIATLARPTCCLERGVQVDKHSARLQGSRQRCMSAHTTGRIQTSACSTACSWCPPATASSLQPPSASHSSRRILQHCPLHAVGCPNADAVPPLQQQGGCRRHGQMRSGKEGQPCAAGPLGGSPQPGHLHSWHPQAF